MNEWASDLGLLFLRLGVGGVFLYAAWKNTENEAARNWTVNETSLLFGHLPEPQRMKWAKLSALIGMIMMYGGGLSVLLGLEPRLGGAVLAGFSLMGMKIHAIRRDEAKAVAEAGTAIAWSAFSGHIAAGLKNWAIVGAGLLLALIGAGRYGFQIDYLGKALGL